MPKVMEALTIWRTFPRQIASDLQRFFQRRIAEWHSGEMSSFELLELFGASVVDDPEKKTRTIRVDFAPENGAVADALRGGERPEWKRMLAQSANIAAFFRASKMPDADTDEYGEQLFLPVRRQRELEAERMELEDERRRTQSDDPEPGGLYAQWHVKEVS
jgi:hypothetical protein